MPANAVRKSEGGKESSTSGIGARVNILAGDGVERITAGVGASILLVPANADARESDNVKRL